MDGDCPGRAFDRGFGEALQLSDPPPPNTAQQINALTHQVESLLDDAVKAFIEGNADSARALMSIPQQVEHAMDGIYDSLIESDKKRTRREMVAEFVVFGLLKRVADQAKNICDQTVFAITGEIKPTKVFSILFLDETNSYQSQMAEAIARKRYSDSGTYASAGRKPADQVDPLLAEFLEELGDSSFCLSRSPQMVGVAEPVSLLLEGSPGGRCRTPTSDLFRRSSKSRLRRPSEGRLERRIAQPPYIFSIIGLTFATSKSPARSSTQFSGR